MSDLTSQGSLHLEVRNFGPIVNAEIDLRPLTVFVGPSNTGKSYLAILIYALHQHFSGRSSAAPGLSRFTQRARFPRNEVWEFSRQDIDSLTAWAEQTFAPRKERDTSRISMPAPIADVIRRALEAHNDVSGDLLQGEIMRCFGIDEARKLIRKKSKTGARIVLRKHSSKDLTLSRNEMTIKNKKTQFGIEIAKGTPIQIVFDQWREYELNDLYHMGREEMANQTEKTSAPSSLSSWWASQMVGVLADCSLPDLVDPLHHTAFYLPADRTGVMHTHSAVVSAAIEAATMRGLSPTPAAPMLSGVLADFLRQLIELGDPEHRRPKPRHHLDSRIEEAMLSGSVNVRAAAVTGYPRFTYRPNGWTEDLPLMNASSMVSELASVVLYLRHIVEAGNVLIVEEPESHLHPGMQVEFTRQLVRLVRSGVRVVVTTHSDWVLEELANVVLRSKLPKSNQKDITGDDNDDCALSPEQVGVWWFRGKQGSKGSEVKEVHLDNESGIYPSDFEEVAESLHNNWSNIDKRI